MLYFMKYMYQYSYLDCLFKFKDILIPLLELVPKAIEVLLLVFTPKKLINDIL